MSVSPPEAAPQAQRRPGGGWRFFWFLVLMLLLGGLVYVNVMIYLSVLLPVGDRGVVGWVQSITDPEEKAFEGRDRMRLLCVGLDYNYDRRDQPSSKTSRTDTMMVVGFDRPYRSIGVLSIPRDTRVSMGLGRGEDKINAAYAYGGLTRCRDVVAAFLGIPIDHYVIIHIDGAKKMVDALGGLWIDVEKDMNYDDTWGHLHIHLKKGRQRLTGEEAVAYARFRHDPEGDRGRIRRQQQVMHAVVDTFKRLLITNPDRLQAVGKAFNNLFETDLTAEQVLALIVYYKDFSKGALQTGAVEGADRMIGGVYYLVPDEAKKDEMVRMLLNGGVPLSPAPARADLPPESLR